MMSYNRMDLGDGASRQKSPLGSSTPGLFDANRLFGMWGRGQGSNIGVAWKGGEKEIRVSKMRRGRKK